MSALLGLIIVCSIATQFLAALGFKCLLMRRDTLAADNAAIVVSPYRIQRTHSFTEQNLSSRRLSALSTVAAAPSPWRMMVAVLGDDRCWVYLWTVMLGIAYSCTTCSVALFWFDADGHGVMQHTSVFVGDALITCAGFSAVISLVFSLRPEAAIGKLWVALYGLWIFAIWASGVSYIIIYVGWHYGSGSISVPVAAANAIACAARALTLPRNNTLRIRVVLFALAVAQVCRAIMASSAVQDAVAQRFHEGLVWIALEVATALPLAIGILCLHWR